MIRLIFCLLLLVGFIGCKSRPLGPYTSPRVTGQVLAADSRQPLVGVSVIRGLAETPPKGSQPKGGEIMMRKVPILTGENGRFELASERVLSIFRGSSWNMVSLSFDRIGYFPFHTNCPTGGATNADGGELVLDLGPILLQPMK